METFVLRIWLPAASQLAAEGGLADPLHGLVEHVASGRTDRFHSAEHLLELVRGTLQAQTGRDDSNRNSEMDG